MIEQVLLDTQRAFDAVAPDYDRLTCDNATLDAVRAHAVAAVARHLPSGSRLLELGCGPGRDAVSLARRGYRLTAIDWSNGMVSEARRRIAEARLDAMVDVHHLGIHDLDQLDAGPFDGVYSNLDPFNCVPNLAAAARLIAGRLRPGGVLVASVIGRVCPWEIGLYLSRGNLTRVRMRFARRLVPVPLNGGRVWTRYYTPREFERPFVDAGFRRVSLRAIGLFVPPPYMQAFMERHPRLVAVLGRVEGRTGAWPGVRACGDHFLVVMRKG